VTDFPKVYDSHFTDTTKTTALTSTNTTQHQNIPIMANTGYTPPGRLGDPNMNVTTDPRTNPKISQLLTSMGMADMLNEYPEPSTWSIESLTPYMAATDAAIMGMYNNLPNELPGDADEPEIETSTQTIKGVDDNDIILYIYRPKSAQGPLPAVVYSVSSTYQFVVAI
jgi:hypothetical protein